MRTETTLADYIARLEGIGPGPAPGSSPPTAAQPGDWLNSMSSDERKEMPVYSGFMAYFPDAIAAIARHSKAGNDKHNPGQPLHWSRDKSSDHVDCEARHMLGGDTRDTADGTLHKIGKAWRAMADLQVHIERLHGRGEKV